VQIGFKLIIIVFVKIVAFENQLMFFEKNHDTQVGSLKPLFIK
jgi:hypothetical protein